MAMAPQNYTLTEPAVLLWTAIALSTLALAWWLQRRVADTSSDLQPSHERHGIVSHGVTLATGASVLALAYAGKLLVPCMPAEVGLLHLMLYAQGIAGALLVVGFGLGAGAALLVMVWICLTVTMGVADALSSLHLLGLAVFVLLSRSGRTAQGLSIALWLVRVTLGISLITAALTEKLLDPRAALVFLQRYPGVNFMQDVGCDYSNRLFALSAGACEVIFGALLLCGWMTRATAAGLLTLLLLSNVYFVVAGCPHEALVEAVGHLPIIGALAVTLILGRGCSLTQLRTLMPTVAMGLPVVRTWWRVRRLER